MRPKHLSLSAAAAASVLCLTIVPAMADTVTVQPGQTLWSISKTEHVSLQSLEAANPSVNVANLLVGTVLQLPAITSQQANTYIIQPGDTFWRIANRYSMSAASIMKENPTINPSNLLVGTTISIPSNAQSSAQTLPVSSISNQSISNNTPNSVSNIDTQNLYWMERAIHAEADGEPLEAQIGVGDVILHRLQTGTYGNTAKDVLFQVINGHYQFTCVANGQIYASPTTTSIEAADDVLYNHQDVVPGAFVFYNPAKTASGSWVLSQPTVAKIGDFIFAK